MNVARIWVAPWPWGGAWAVLLLMRRVAQCAQQYVARSQQRMQPRAEPRSFDFGRNRDDAVGPRVEQRVRVEHTVGVRYAVAIRDVAVLSLRPEEVKCRPESHLPNRQFHEPRQQTRPPEAVRVR